jgi:predicted esterase
MKAVNLIKRSFVCTGTVFFGFRPTSSFSFVFANIHLYHCRPEIPSTSKPTNTRPTTLLQSKFHMEGAVEHNNLSSFPMETLRVLALHGSEENAEEFPHRWSALNETLVNHANMKLDITAVQAPFPKGSGYSWWTMPPGVRSFHAKEYEGFEESATKVLDVWKTAQNEYDVVLGHSQGAILIASLLVLKRTPYHPKLGYIFNGVAFPNPFTANIESLTVKDHNDDNNNNHIPNILFILGRQDKITPNSSGEQLRERLSKAGFQVDSCYHDGGHGPPQLNDPSTLIEIVRWIQQRGRGCSKL